MATRASPEDISELLGEHVDEAIVERLASTGASIDEIGEALDDLDHERRFGETRQASSQRIEEVRSILEELPPPEDETVADADEAEEQEHDRLTVVDAEDLMHEPG